MKLTGTIAALVCVACFCIVAWGCMTQGASRETESISPDGTVKRTKWQAHNNSLSWTEAAQMGGMLWESGIGKAAAAAAVTAMGGTTGGAGLIAWLLTRMRGNAKIAQTEAEKEREAARREAAAYDEGAARARKGEA